jgi:hypothetical protein
VSGYSTFSVLIQPTIAGAWVVLELVHHLVADGRLVDVLGLMQALEWFVAMGGSMR